jgi:acetylornithine/succinyldiaminopimelate/putrescine aminotransferase
MTNRQIFLNHVAQTIDTPLGIEIVRAEGIYLYGPDGEKYMDMISGISVSSLGHCHPAVVKAVQDQASKFMHLMVYGEYIYSPQVKLAQALAHILPKSLDNFYFVNSGTEATEGALKLAKRYTKRTEIVSCHQAYHGSTAGALSAMGSEDYKSAFRPLIPGHFHIQFNVEEDLNKITEKTAAVLIEVVQAESGIIVGNESYFYKLRQRCTELGVLLIFDEIQTGIGRTGSMFAFEQIGVVPDILLLGKALGGGMPIAAFVASKNVMQVLSHHPILGHISTFGGNAVTCAAALAVVETLTHSTILSEVESKGQLLESELRNLGFTHIRRKGLMLGIDHGDQETNFAFIKKCVDNGLITDWFLFNTQTMRICPPLTITEAEISLFISKLQTLL